VLNEDSDGSCQRRSEDTTKAFAEYDRQIFLLGCKMELISKWSMIWEPFCCSQII